MLKSVKNSLKITQRPKTYVYIGSGRPWRARDATSTSQNVAGASLPQKNAIKRAPDKNKRASNKTNQRASKTKIFRALRP